VTESKRIVKNLLEMRQPIGVDMEGIVDGTVSMIQVCDVNRNITLFRTGVNPAMYWEGGLAGLLEAPGVKKIMHGSVTDCLAAYRDKVKLWNLYDTAVAYKVLDYQLHGTSMFSSQQIGFNGLCRYFNVEENPVKDMFRNVLWRMMITKNGEKGIDTADTLDDELLVYCAWDVDPLHKLHDLLNLYIAPAYSHLVMQLSEIEIIRAIDSQLSKQKRSNLKNKEVRNVFLSNLPDNLSPPDLYTSLTFIVGHKHIYFSEVDRTANIILDSREDAVLAYKSFSEWGDKLGPEVSCNLVIEDYGNTTGVIENNKLDDMTHKPDFISHTECKRIVDSLIKSECPVVVDFLQFPMDTTYFMELYVGSGSAVKVMITQETVELGELGKLLSSSNIVKIVPRLDLGPVLSSLRLLNNLKVEVRNVFEVSTAANSVDYLELGQSLFKQEVKSLKNMSLYLGIPMLPTGSASSTTIKLHFCYMAYLHLSTTIPQHFQQLLAEFTAVQVGVGSYEDSLFFKQKRKAFKTRLDGRCLHLRLVGDKKKDVTLQKQRKMEELVKTVAGSINIPLVEYNPMGRCAIVEFENGEAVRTVIEELAKREESTDVKFKASHPMVLQTRLEQRTTPEVNMNNLEEQLNNAHNKLKASGFIDNHE